MRRFLLPLGIFVVLLIFLGIGLTLNPRELPSALKDKPAPAFNLAQLQDSSKTFTPTEMKGKVWLLNVWASWCVSCREEHPVLLDLSKQGTVPIIGLNYKDERENGLRWLQLHGNPYVLTAYDREGRVGIDYGVYGVPETFVIDKTGVIRYRHPGPISRDALKNKILPLVKELQGA
jgi:cytochrome c biogenesis protein CcmG/thiol:disulfide interchange protein DsbE